MWVLNRATLSFEVFRACFFGLFVRIIVVCNRSPAGRGNCSHTKRCNCVFPAAGLRRKHQRHVWFLLLRGACDLLCRCYQERHREVCQVAPHDAAEGAGWKKRRVQESRVQESIAAIARVESVFICCVERQEMKSKMKLGWLNRVKALWDFTFNWDWIICHHGKKKNGTWDTRGRLKSLVVLSTWYPRPTLKRVEVQSCRLRKQQVMVPLQDFAASPGHLPCTIAVWGGLHLFGAHRGGHWEDHCCGQGGLRRPLSWDVISGGCFHRRQ